MSTKPVKPDAAMNEKPEQNGNIISPADLMPKREPAPAYERFWYHVGLLPSMPCFRDLSIGGVSFSVSTEMLWRKTNAQKVDRISCPGALVLLSRDQVRAIADVISRSFVRIIGAVPQESGTGQNRGDPAARQRALVMRLPSADDIKAWKTSKRGLNPSRITIRPDDRPLAQFLYMTWLDEPQPATPGADSALPLCVATIGIQIPPPDANPAHEGTLPRASGNVLHPAVQPLEGVPATLSDELGRLLT